ncbi:hypothetical protein DFH27DRAFT_561626 [Peziza echinospora]|nr:hypothetical protein DFH27DRAFT_561626 [Peziza echinospora]
MGPSSGLQFPAPEGVLGSAGNIDVDIDINIPTGKVPGPDCEILDPGILAGDAQEEEVAKTPDPKDKLPDQVATSQTSPTTTTTTTPPPPPPTPPIPAPPLSLSHWEPTILSPDTIHTLTLLATEINTACKAYSNLHPRPSTLPPLVPYPYPFHQPPPLENDPNQERLLRDMAYARQVGEDSVWWNISFSLLGPDGKDGSERLLDVMKAWREGEGWRMDMAMGGGGALD